MNLDALQEATSSLGQQVMLWSPNLVAALAILFGFWLLSRLTRPPLKAALRRADFSRALTALLVDSVYRITLLAIGLVMAAGQLGINVTAALASFGVAGIAVGFAAQDALANTIAGFMIFWDKPFQVGDFISVSDEYGEVKDITLRTTRIRTPDNTYVVIPNKGIIDDVLVNHSMYGETRLNVPVGIAYKEEIAAARGVLVEAAKGVDGVLQEPPPQVTVSELGSSSVDLKVRVWIATAQEERPVFFRVLECCKVALDEAGIEIPFPHLQLFLEDIREPAWKDKLARLAS